MVSCACSQSSDGRTALYLACQAGHVDIVDLLIEQGASIDATDDKGRNPLMAAAAMGHVGVVRRLLREEPDVARKDKKGRTVLYYPMAKNHPEVLRALIMEGGAMWGTKEEEGPTNGRAERLGHWRCLEVWKVTSETGGGGGRGGTREVGECTVHL